jgi:hypothetical protein
VLYITYTTFLGFQYVSRDERSGVRIQSIAFPPAVAAGSTYVFELSGSADDADGTARFDTDDSGRIEVPEVLNAISAYSTDSTVGGEPVTIRDVLRVIDAYNTG